MIPVRKTHRKILGGAIRKSERHDEERLYIGRCTPMEYVVLWEYMNTRHKQRTDSWYTYHMGNIKRGISYTTAAWFDVKRKDNIGYEQNRSVC